MRRPIHTWKNTLDQLGLIFKQAISSKKRVGRSPSYRSLCIEPLEVRAVLTTSVSIVADASTVSEAGSATGFTVTRDNTTGSLTVPFTVGGSATNGTDYSTIGSSVTFTSGNSTASIGLTPTNDSSVEGNETISISLTPSLDNSYTIPPLSGFATITIVDDDMAPTVSVAASGTPAEGGATGTFTVSRTGSTSGSLVVSYMMSGTATGGGTDYSGPGSSVTIASGQSTASVTLTVVDDGALEPTESATLSLSSSMNYSVGTPSSATLNINDNDYVTVTASGSPSEAGPTTGTYTITRPGSTSGSLMVGYSMSGAAVNGTDFSSLLGSVTISSGSATATVTLSPTNDSVVENLESAILTLSTSSFYTPSPTSGAATLNIADNDFVWVTASGTPSEQGPATGTYTIHRPGSTSGSLAISYAMTGTATGGGTDYATLTGSATISSGQSTVDVTLTPVDDAVSDSGETAIFTLSTSGTFTSDPTAGTATLTIADNEVWVTASGDPSEQGPVNGTFTLHRDGPTTSSLVIAYTTDGDATPGVDYLAVPTSNPAVYYVTIPAGESAVDVFLNTINDDILEEDEAASLTVNSSSNYTIAAGSGTAALTIDDNDEWTVGVTAVGDATALEDGEVPGQFLISRSGETDLTYPLSVTFAIAIASTASEDDHDLDYSSAVIPAGALSVLIDVRPVNDSDLEEDESLIVNLTGSDDYAIDEEADSATLTIIDNDQWTVGITAPISEAFEEEQLPGTFLITRSGQCDFTYPLTVSVAVDSESTATGADYDEIFATYEIPAGEASLLVSLAPVDDSVTESDESAILDLVADSAYSLADNDSATVTIHDHVLSEWNIVNISTDSQPASESGPVIRQFTLTRTGPTDDSLTIGYLVSGTAVQGVDYDNLSGTDPAVNYVTIAAEESSVTVIVTPIPDDQIEDDETVTMWLTNACGVSAVSTIYAVGTANVATVTIAALPQVNILAGELYASEQGPTPGEFVIFRSGPTTVSLDVNFVVSGSATSAVDFEDLAFPESSPPSYHVTIPVGESSVVLNVVPLDDEDSEGNETVTVALVAPAGYGIGLGNHATVTIDDDEVNETPEPGNDAYHIPHGQVFTSPAESGVLANDVDADGDSLTASLVSGPASGTLNYLHADGSFQFTPATGFIGSVTFVYEISDGTTTAEASVQLDVANMAPIAGDDDISLTTEIATDVTFSQDDLLFNDVDFDGDTISVVAIGPTMAGGSFVQNLDGTFTYTPPANWDGTDYADYVISDGIQTAHARINFSLWADAAELLDFPIVIKVAAFIPLSKGNAVNWDTPPAQAIASLRWLPEPFGVAVAPWVFATDNRENPGAAGTSKVFSEGSFMASDIGSLSTLGADVFTTDTSFSHRVKTLGSYFTPTAYKHTLQNAKAEFNDHEDRADGTGTQADKSLLAIRAGAAYPFITGSPQINYDIALTFQRKANGTIVVNCFGWHDAFPAYEIIINGQTVYFKYPTGAGPTPLNLGGWNTVKVTGQVTISPPEE